MKYFEIKKKYLAEGLAFLGFKYYKFCTPEYTLYSFVDTPEFRSALNEMLKLKSIYNRYW